MVTIRDIVDRLGVSLGAIRLWRDGSSEREPLVFESEIVGAGTRVWIEEADLLAYLTHTGLIWPRSGGQGDG